MGKKNSAQKACTGQSSPTLTLYPKLFYDSKFEQYTLPALSEEYPEYDWVQIQKYINPPGDQPPKIINLIEEFNVFITKQFLSNYPEITIPRSLQDFVLDDNYNVLSLRSVIDNLAEPPYKKRRLEPEQMTLSLPSLNMSPKSSNHSNSIQKYLSNATSLSFELNNNYKGQSVSPSNIELNKNVKRKKRKRRGIGPICGACNTEINPCRAMIKCAECENIIICIECFKIGREFCGHKRLHRYNVLNPLHSFKLKS